MTRSAVSSIFGLVLTFLPLAAPAFAAERLVPGVPVERGLKTAERHVYALETPVTGRWLVTVEQLGVDVALTLRPPAKALSWKLDSPLDRDGSELLLLPAGTSHAEVEVRARVAAGAGARYRLVLASIADETRLAALTAMTFAGRSYAAETAAGRRQALVQYAAARGAWERLGERRLAAQCLYAMAVLHRLLGEGPRALELARAVLPRWRALGDDGREADTLNEIGLLENAAEHGEPARAAFEQAQAVARRSGDAFREATISSNLCVAWLGQGQLREGLACYRDALPRIKAVGDGETEATALVNLGRIHDVLGEPEPALERFEQALVLHRAAGRKSGEAEVLNYLGLLHRQLGEPQQAVEHYLAALEVFRTLGDRRREARSLHNLARAYLSLGDPERALALGRRALAIREELGEPIANTLKTLGGVELALDRPGSARGLFTRAAALEHASGDRRGEGVALGWLARAELALGEPAVALTSFDRALALVRAVGDRAAEGVLQLGRGRVLTALGRLGEARSELESALVRLRACGDRDGEAEALYRLARVERAAGRQEAALARVDEALARLEALRAEMTDPDALATFAGDRRGAYELRLELLMTLHLADPGETRHLRAALKTSERARAWGLVELLGETELPASPRLRGVRRRFAAEARRYREQLAAASGDAETTRAEADLLRALGELEAVEAESRRQDPAETDLERPRPLETAEIQALLDPQTALLELALGEERSFLFVVTARTLRAVELPARAVLESAGLAAHRALSAPGGSGAAAVELARLLLGAALDGLDGERLVVVTDGALDYLPFAALPVPGAETEPLLARYEVVHLPSASVLAAERRRSARRAPARGWAAIVADPVFDRRDLRLPAAIPPASDAPEPAGLELPRLRRSRQEAETIAALARPGEVLLALDFDADRELAQSGRLEDFRIVHFATHAVVDARFPALSGLALSSFDRQGRPRDGFLRLRDIAALRLRAELVVLSACRTALGKQVRGEGFLGLVRGFLDAGARRVVASLWSVDDRSTSELMTRFYRAQVEDGLAPAAALRRAQLALRQQRRSSDPHHWAGFVLVGDWR